MYLSVLAIAQIIVSFIIATVCIIIGILMMRHGIITRNKGLRVKSYLTILGGSLFSAGLFWPAAFYLYTEHLWYEQLTYDSVFWKIINAHWWILFEFALIAAAFMMLNLIIANRLCPLAKGFARWTKRGSLVNHIAAAIFILFLAVLISAPMMLLWEDFLLYKEQVPVGENEISVVDTEEKTVTALLTGQARPRGLAFDKEGVLYVAGSDQVFTFNRESGIFTTVVSELSGPRAIAMDANGHLYIAEADTGRLSKVTGSPAKLNPIELSRRLSRPMSIVFGEGEVLYVAEADSGEVSRIDLNTGDVTTVAKGFSRPMSIAFDANDKGLLYVAEAGSGEISRFRLPYGPNADVEIHTMVLSLPRPIRSVTFDKQGFLYVAAGNEIYRIDTSTLTPDNPKTAEVKRLIRGLSNPMSLAFDAEGTLYVAEWGTGQISTVNTKNGNLKRLPSEFARSVDLAFDNEGTMYVASDDEVFTADITGRDFKRLAKGLTRPKGLTIATKPEKAIYVSKDDKVFKVDTSTGEHTALAKGLKKPRGLAYDEERGVLYVAEFGGNDIKKIVNLRGDGNLRHTFSSIILSKKQRKQRVRAILEKMMISRDNINKLLKRFEEGEDMFDEALLAEEKYILLSPEEKKRFLSEEYVQDRELFKSLAEDLSGPMSVVLDKTGENLYVAEWSTGEISKVNVKTGYILKVVSGLSSPKDLVYDSDKNLLYVAESGSGDISVIDLNSESATISILVGGLSSPTSLAFDKDKKLYMAESIDTDPIFNKEVRFYMFTYPVHKWVSIWIKALLWVTILFMAVMYNYYYRRDPQSMARARKASVMHFSILWLMLLATSIWRSRLNISELLLKRRSAPWASFSSKVHGMGSADVQQALSYNIFIFIVVGIAALLIFNMFWRKRFLWYTAVAVWIAGYIVIVQIYPALYQRLKVDPNKKIIEIPYIKHNINGTRKAYGLDKIKEERFIKGIASLGQVKRHPEILKNVQLWDRHVLYLTLRELEAYRDYYNFDPDTDVDRYWVRNEEGKLEYRQLMLAAREVYPAGLPSKDWINTRFIYTHGYGVVVTPVNMYTEEGMPVMWINEIPPVVKRDFGFKKIRVPEIYFGELTKDYVFVKTREKELDYPQLSEEIGEGENKYTTYKGHGGIPLGSGLRRLAFFWRFARLNVFLTHYLKEDSEVMFRRQIEERIRAAAPILKFDPDPFIVIGNSGKLWWVIDTYVTNAHYPYSEPHRHPEYGKFNYIRNAAVAIVDAYNGDVNFYILEEDEPLIQTYRKIFPSLFKPKEDIPDGVAAHLRFPDTLTYILAQKYTDYHVREPKAFIDESSSWHIPEETYTNDNGDDERIKMRPYYATLVLPNEEKPEFVNMIPFTPPKAVVNMSAWLVARCDQPHYGEMIVYTLPKGKNIAGPEQIEKRIGPQGEISNALLAWKRTGSIARRGNLLVIPVENSLFYVEPIYAQEKIEAGTASGEAQLPLLKMVVVAAEDKLAAGETFDKALEKVFIGEVLPPVVEMPAEAETTSAQPPELSEAEGQTGGSEPEAVAKDKGKAVDDNINKLLVLAKTNWVRYQIFESDGKTKEADEAWDEFQQNLKDLMREGRSEEVLELLSQLRQETQ